MNSWPVGPLTVGPGAPATFNPPGGSYSIAAAAFINMSALLLFCSCGSDGPFLCGPGGSVLVPFSGQSAQASAAPGSTGSGPVLVQYMDVEQAAIWQPPGTLTPQAADPGGSIATPINVAAVANSGAFTPILPQRTDGGQYTIYSATVAGYYNPQSSSAVQHISVGIPDPLNPVNIIPLVQCYLLPLTTFDRDHAELAFPNPVMTPGPVDLAVGAIALTTTVAEGSVVYSR